MTDITLDAQQTTALLTWTDLASARRARAHDALQTARLEKLRELAAAHGRLKERCEELSRQQAEHESRADAFEQEADALRTRIARTEERLNSGEGLTSRDLLGLQDEIAGLRDKVQDIETNQVDELESAETAAEALAGETARADQVAGEGRELQAERAAEAQRLTAAIADLDAQLEQAASELPPPVRGRLTVQGEYPAAATVTAGGCGACGAQLSGSALDAYRNAVPGMCVECEDCGALLVRTGE